jgi:hypothetical protein
MISAVFNREVPLAWGKEMLTAFYRQVRLLVL